MKKHIFLAMIFLSVNSVMLPAINKGYTELDKLFGFYVEPTTNSCKLCYKPHPSSYSFNRNTPDSTANEVVCNKMSCDWSKVFHILDFYHIDPKTYYLKTPEGKFSQEKLLDLAVSQENMKAVKTLINKYGMNITDNVFVVAIKNNRQRALKFLLESGGVPTGDVIRYVYDGRKQWAIKMFASYGMTKPL